MFRCKSHHGCFPKAQLDASIAGCKTCAAPTLDLTAGCQEHYTGHFCATCVDDYEMKPIADDPAALASEPGFECVQCEGVTARSGLMILAVAAVVTPLIVLRKRIAARLMLIVERNPARIAAARAMLRSVWQPIRIIIT